VECDGELPFVGVKSLQVEVLPESCGSGLKPAWGAARCQSDGLTPFMSDEELTPLPQGEISPVELLPGKLRVLV